MGFMGFEPLMSRSVQLSLLVVNGKAADCKANHWNSPFSDNLILTELLYYILLLEWLIEPNKRLNRTNWLALLQMVSCVGLGSWISFALRGRSKVELACPMLPLLMDHFQVYRPYICIRPAEHYIGMSICLAELRRAHSNFSSSSEPVPMNLWKALGFPSNSLAS